MVLLEQFLLFAVIKLLEMKKLSFILASMMIALLSLTSCNQDDIKPQSEITPEEYKEEIKNNINEAADIINNTMNEDLLKVVKGLQDIIDESSPLKLDSENGVNPLERFAEATIDLCETNNPLNLIKYAAAYAPLKYLYGTYEFGKFGWNKSENPDGIEIIYYVNAKKVVWEILPGKEEQTCTLIIKSPDSGAEIINQDLILPKSISATITWGDQLLYEMKSDMDISSNMDSFKINVGTNANGIKSSLYLDLTPSIVDLRADASIDGKEIIGYKAFVNGSGMTDIQNLFTALYKEDYGIIINTFKDAKTETRFMNEIILNAACKDIPKILNVFMNDYDTEEEFFRAFHAAFVDNVTIDFCYVNSDNVIASIYTEIVDNEVEIYITFPADGTTMPIEDYFDDNYLREIEDRIDDILDTIEKYFPDIF